MDLFHSRRSDPVWVCLKDNDISLSLVPGGCTGLLQPLDVSVNRPFKDILKDKIDKDFEHQQLHNKEIATSSSAIGEMRVMMTRCVAEAWEIFCWDKTGVVIRSFRCLGIALPIDGSCDEELSIKGLETTSLVGALKDWKTQGVTVDCPSDSGDDSNSNSSGPDEDLQEDFTVSGPAPPL